LSASVRAKSLRSSRIDRGRGLDVVVHPEHVRGVVLALDLGQPVVAFGAVEFPDGLWVSRLGNGGSIWIVAASA
jgi:hypothetical protein